MTCASHGFSATAQLAQYQSLSDSLDAGRHSPTCLTKEATLLQLCDHITYYQRYYCSNYRLDKQRAD